WALDSIEVEGRFVGEVLHLERRAHGHSLAADEVPEPGRVEELRVDRLLQVAETDALPAPEVLVHVAGRPGERELVARSRDAAEREACRAVGEEVRAIRDAIALEGAEGALARGVAEIEVGGVRVEGQILAGGSPAERGFD